MKSLYFRMMAVSHSLLVDAAGNTARWRSYLAMAEKEYLQDPKLVFFDVIAEGRRGYYSFS